MPQKVTQKDIEAEGLASISFRAPPMAANTRPPHAIDPDMGKQSTAQINMQIKLTFGGPKEPKGYHRKFEGTLELSAT